MSRKQHRTNATQQSESVSEMEQQGSSEMEEQSSSEIEEQNSVSGNPNIIPWESAHKAFKGFISETNTEDKLLTLKKDIEAQLLKINKKAAKHWVSSYKEFSPELQKIILDEIKTVLKEQRVKKNKGQEQRRDLFGYKPITIYGVEYKVVKYINTETNTIWKSGNPNNTPWLKDLDDDERAIQFGTVEKLQENPELLEEFARIPEAVYVKQDNGEYVPYLGKQDAEPAVEE